MCVILNNLLGSNNGITALKGVVFVERVVRTTREGKGNTTSRARSDWVGGSERSGDERRCDKC